MLGLGDPLRGYGLRMMQNFVTDFAFVQTIDELQWYFHNWLRCTLSLSRAISTSCAQRSATKNPQILEVRSPSSAGARVKKTRVSGRENQANTAAKATARERVMYGYMRSLRK